MPRLLRWTWPSMQMLGPALAVCVKFRKDVFNGIASMLGQLERARTPHCPSAMLPIFL